MKTSRRTFLLAAALGGLLAVGAAEAQDVCDGVAPVNETGLKTVLVATGLTGEPLFVTAAPGDPGRIYIVEQNGFVWIKRPGDDPTVTSEFLDISGVVSGAGSEMGLLGLAFDPEFDPGAGNGDFYVYYTEDDGASNLGSVVARYSATSRDAGNPASEVRILTFDQPESNHNAGFITFGPDGFLYVFTGDGGGRNDNHGTCGNGQDTTNLLGNILRLDVRGVDPDATAPDCGNVTFGYEVPSDNPFADGAGGTCDEIWDYGLRNPWRSSFDTATGDLYVADVGERCWEEINYVAAADAGGHNYGWRQMEGSRCFSPTTPLVCDPAPVSCPGSPPCGDPGLTDPVVEFSHGEPSNPCSVTGGYVYRGCRMSGIQGTYFYGDYCAGFVRTFEIVAGAPVNPQNRTDALDPTGVLTFNLTSFGTDSRGEIYVTAQDGHVLKILPLFTDLEVSGAGAAEALHLNRDGDWTWEDLHRSTDHPVRFYRIYRGLPGGTFRCIHSTLETAWAAGDTTDPASGELLAYVVTAVSYEDEESSSGNPTRTMADPCPAP